MICKVKYYTICFLISSLLVGQEQQDAYSIGLDYKSKVKIEGLSESRKDVIQNFIDGAFSRTINQTKEFGWNIKFEQVSNDKIEAILRQQKDLEDLSECTDNQCAIKLGKLVGAKYMIYRDIINIDINLYQIQFQLINIETGLTLFTTPGLLFEGKLFSKKAQNQIEILMTELFNGAFTDQLKLPTTIEGVEKTIVIKNNPPVIENINLSISHSKSKAITLTNYASDKEDNKMSFRVVGEPKNGAYSLKKDVLVYKPKKGFIGKDSIKYIANDASNDSEVGVINIEIKNVLPIAKNITVTGKENQLIPIYLDGLDSDGDLLSYVIVEKSKKGTIKTGNRKTLRNQVRTDSAVYFYSPDLDYSGKDSIVYRVFDGVGYSKNAVVSITIKEDNSRKTNIVAADNNEKEGGPNMLLIVGGLLLLVLLGSAGGGGGGAGGGSGTGIVDIGIVGP